MLSTFMVAVCGSLFAQQDKLITHFIFDKMSVNPGSTGMDNGFCATSIYRNQWDKVNGAPNSAVLNLEGNMERFFPGGLGISFYHDAIGFNRQNNALLNYSYPIEVPGSGKLGIGVGVGIINMGNSPVWEPPTTTVDNALPVGFAATNLDLNFGVYWKGSTDYYVGLSSTHLSESVLTQDGVTDPYKYHTRRHYYLMGGKKFLDVLGGDIDANMLVRTDFVKVSADINVRYIWNQMAYGGLTYRNADAIGVMLGFMPMTNFTVGYNYDITMNKLNDVSRGSHEILLKYCYFLPPPPVTKSNHPRWL